MTRATTSPDKGESYQGNGSRNATTPLIEKGQNVLPGYATPQK
jgi:hypothetical protein